MPVSKTTAVYNGQRNDCGKKLLQFANDCRGAEQFNDVVIKVGSETFSANRMVLSCYSDFFKTMFQSSMKEQYQGTIEIKDFDGATIKLLVDFIYTGNISINSENAMALLMTADFLQLHEVKEFCFNFFESEMSADNCLDIIKASHLYKPNSTLTDVYNYISDNLNDVANTCKFKSFSKLDLLSLLQKLDKNRVSEEEVFRAIVNWVKFKRDLRKANFVELFRMVNLYNLPSKYLEDTVATNSLVRENVTCLNLLVSGISKKFKDLRMAESGTNVLSIGGNFWGSVIETHYIYGNSSTYFPTLPIELSYHCCVKFKNCIYCIGGAIDHNFDNTSRRVFRMSLLSKVKSWEELTSMREKKRFLGAAVFQKVLVIAGGSTETGYVNKTEMYDDVCSLWKALSPLNHARSGHGLVSCGNFLYAVGGLNADKKLLSSVERLSHVGGKWEIVASLQTARNCSAVVSFAGCIYAIGGQGKKVRLKSVEKYIPEENRWQFVSDLQFERYRHAACVFRGRILVIGGLNFSEEAVHQMECYDAKTNVWTKVGEIQFELYGHSLVVI